MKKVDPHAKTAPKEGELYRAVTTFGKTFELRYGYYDEKDRKWGDPDVLYPDFLKEPVYTDENEPFVTLVQDACTHFLGEAKKSDDSSCAECEYFRRGEEWFGICTCQANRKKE